MILELCVLGGLVYAGRKTFPRRKGRGGDAGNSARPVPDSLAPPPVRHDLACSSVSLGLATSGAVLGWPLLGLASLPGLLFVFVPTYDRAWRAVRQRRVDLEVLDATRVTVCIVMGYTVVAALDALLHAVSRRLLQRGESHFRNTLDETFGKRAAGVWVYRDGVELETPAAEVRPGAIVVLGIGDTVPAAGVVLDGRGRVRPALAGGPDLAKRSGDRLAAGGLVVSGRFYLRLEETPAPAPIPHEVLERAALGPTLIRRIGERSGERLTPWMLAAFVLAMPWLGVNRAAAFLTVRCGAQLRYLGPHTARQAIGYGARHGILVCRIAALELASLVNTVVIDARVLADPAVRAGALGLVHALRQRPWPAAQMLSQPFAVHVLADTDEDGRRLQEALGLDDYFVEPSAAGRATLLQNLQLGGRWLCYVGTGEGDAAALGTALLGVAHRPGLPLQDSPAAIVLTDPDLAGLPGLFDLAAAFTARQGGNLSLPIGLDLLDISTTVFLHFGLVYSVLLSHVGLFSCVARAGFPKTGPAPELEPPPPAGLPALPCPDPSLALERGCEPL